MNLAGKTAAAQIFQNCPARRGAARATADYGDGPWRKQSVQTIGRHFPSGPKRAVADPLVEASGQIAHVRSSVCRSQSMLPICR